MGDGLTANSDSSNQPNKVEGQGSDLQLNPVFSQFNPPHFEPSNPNVWFRQLEVMFTTRHITSELTRYSYLVQALPFNIVAIVEDLLDPIPAEKPYTILKAEILKRTAKSPDSQLRELFHAVELGDDKPSALLRRMRSLLVGRQMDDDIIRRLWLDKLPYSIQHVLAICDSSSPLEKLAENADRIMDCFPGGSSFASVNHASVTPSRQTIATSSESPTISNSLRPVSRSSSLSRARSPQQGFSSAGDTRDFPVARHDDLRDLKETVQLLCSQMTTLMSSINRLQAGRDARPRRRSQSRGRSTDQLCWYHRMYGPKARKCIPPCNYNREQSGNASASQ